MSQRHPGDFRCSPGEAPDGLSRLDSDRRRELRDTAKHSREALDFTWGPHWSLSLLSCHMQMSVCDWEAVQSVQTPSKAPPVGTGSHSRGSFLSESSSLPIKNAHFYEANYEWNSPGLWPNGVLDLQNFVLRK